VDTSLILLLLLRIAALGLAAAAGWAYGPGWPVDDWSRRWPCAACVIGAVACAYYGWPVSTPFEPLGNRNDSPRTWMHWMFYARGWWFLLIALVCGQQLAWRQCVAAEGQG
jgi:hypothetical protein